MSRKRLFLAGNLAFSLSTATQIYANPISPDLTRFFCDQLQSYAMKDHATSRRQESLNRLQTLTIEAQDPILEAWIDELLTITSKKGHSTDWPRRAPAIGRGSDVQRSQGILPRLTGTPALVRECFADTPELLLPKSFTACITPDQPTHNLANCFSQTQILDQTSTLTPAVSAISFWNEHQTQNMALFHLKSQWTCGPSAVSIRLLDLGFQVQQPSPVQPYFPNSLDELESQALRLTHQHIITEKWQFRVTQEPHALSIAQLPQGKSVREPSQHPLLNTDQSLAAFLEEKIRKSGPAIISTRHPRFASDWIIVDEVSQTDGTVRLRDPQLGRMLDISIPAFTKRFSTEDPRASWVESVLFITQR